MMIIKKWEKILNFDFHKEVGIEVLNNKFTDIEFELIDAISSALLENQSFYQDVVNSRCLRLITESIEDGLLECDDIDGLHNDYCDTVYNLGMIPIEMSIFKALDDRAIKSGISLDEIESNREYIIKGIVDTYKKHQDTDEISVSFDLENLIHPILSI